MARFTGRARLRRAQDFSKAFEAGVRVQDALFTAVLKDNFRPFARLGMAVSRKVEPRATQRNRLKRQVRESFREHAATLPGVDIVVLPKRAAAVANAAVVRQRLADMWARITKQCRNS